MKVLSNAIKLAISGSILTLLIMGISSLMDNGVSSLQKNKTKKFNKFSNSDEPGTLEATIRLLTKAGDFTCSGAVISNEYLVTAAHCVVGRKGELTPEMKVQDETKTVTVDATVVGLNHRLDYAIVQGNFTVFKKFKLDQSATMVDNAPPSLEEMMGVTTAGSTRKYKSCGYPMGLNKLHCVEYKPVKNINFQVAGFGTLYPGMSGGPVFDTETNQVYAVNSAVSNDISIVSPLIGVLSAFDLD